MIAVITGGAEKDENGVMQLVGGKFTIAGVDFNYGAFLSAVLNFLIIAFILFCVIKAVNKAMTLGKKKAEEEEEAAPTAAARSQSRQPDALIVLPSLRERPHKLYLAEIDVRWTDQAYVSMTHLTISKG